MAQLLLKDILGPIVVGPSSSHTAGALSIAAMARHLIGFTPRTVTFKLYGSFAHTYRGHGTDCALTAGMLMHIDGMRVEITDKSNSLVIRQFDRKGILTFITTALLAANVNIATLNLYRTSKGGQAFTVIETDEVIPPATLAISESHPDICRASAIQAASGARPACGLSACASWRARASK